MLSNTKSKLIKVVVIGPECTGKSELSEYLADYFNTSWVPEYARVYLDNLNRSYEQSDLLKMAQGQIRIENECITEANKVLICDTNLLVIKIWSEFKFGNCSEEILKLIESRTYDLYLLTNIDLPWIQDPLREHPDKRAELWQIYKSTLAHQKIPVVEINGERKLRREVAVSAIEKLLEAQV